MNPRKTKAEMYPLVEQYLSSSETMTKFCSANNIKVYVLNYWLQKYNKKETSRSSTFQAIEIKETVLTQSILIRYPNGTELTIPFPC